MTSPRNLDELLELIQLEAEIFEGISSPQGLVPEQVLSVHMGEDRSAGLIDQWGRIHFVDDGLQVGREPSARGLLLLDGSISRAHAKISKENGTWFIEDLGSTNGTSVNEERIEARVELRHGDAVVIGQIGFVFVFRSDGLPTLPTSPIMGETIRTDAGIAAPAIETQANEDTYVGMPLVELELVSPTGGGGGVLTIHGKTLQLTVTQYEFVEKLIKRMLDEHDQPALVRGFVPSTELIADLSWETPHPDESHTKQLVRRVRQALARAEIGNLIESRRRFGYRLRFVPMVKS